MKAIHLLIAMCFFALFASCEKKPIDENIEGMWKLEQFTTLDDGIVHRDCQRIFYSIQLQIVQIAEKQCTHKYGTFVGHFYLNEDHSQATMKDFRIRGESTGDSGEDVPVERLLPFGINSLETTFDVLKADGKHLVLQSDYAKLEFTSF